MELKFCTHCTEPKEMSEIARPVKKTKVQRAFVWTIHLFETAAAAEQRLL